ncbi:MAG: phage recombination protein Bet [Fibrobacter sp.]|nr:phage recombination protein Bet [Fibrobacter sp.]
MANEIKAVTDGEKVTEKLLLDYLSTITSKLSDAQRMQFLAVAQAFNLNPFKREVYATTYIDRNGNTQMSVIVGYEVYMKRAEINPNFDGYETEFTLTKSGEIACTCTVFRKDRNHPTKSTVYMGEYSTGKSLWQSKPRVMLEKVAICTAFRRAFPIDFGGYPYAPEELGTSIEDQLKNSGYTEVKASDTKAEFVEKMNKLIDFDSQTTFNALKDMGIADIDDVKGEDYASTYSNCRSRVAEAKKNREKAAEALKNINETEVFNG